MISKSASVNRINLVAVLIVMISLSASVCSGQGVRVQVSDADSPPPLNDDEIANALREVIDVQLVEHSIVEFTTKLAEAISVPIDIDRRSLEDIGLSGEEILTVHLTSMTADNALSTVLEPLDLTYTIQHGQILITTVETAESLLVSRIYNITDLATRTSADLTIRPWKSPIVDSDQICELILSQVEPDTWADVGGPCQLDAVVVRGQVLIAVSQTLGGHDQISALLGSVRSALQSSDLGSNGSSTTDASEEATTEIDEIELAVRVLPIYLEDESNAEIHRELIREVTEFAAWDERDDVSLKTLGRFVVIKHEPEVVEAVQEFLRDLGVLDTQYAMQRRRQLEELPLDQLLHQLRSLTDDPTEGHSTNRQGGLF